MSSGIGEALHGARLAKGVSIEDAHRASAIRADYIEALESETFDVFGADIYAKGKLRDYSRYLGLDPEPLLELYRRHYQRDQGPVTAQLAKVPAAKAPRQVAPAWIIWTVVLAVVLSGAIAVAQVLGSRNPDPAAGRRPPPRPATPSASETPTKTEAVTPTPTPTFDGVALLLTYESDSWTVAVVDGQTIEAGRVITRGTTLDLEGSDEIRLRLGNAGGVRAELNGQDLGAFGTAGQVLNVVCDRQQCEVVPDEDEE